MDPKGGNYPPLVKEKKKEKRKKCRKVEKIARPASTPKTHFGQARKIIFLVLAEPKKSR